MKRTIPILAVAMLLSGCTSFQDVAMKTAENVARAACSAARNCANTCPDGSIASPHTYGCAGRP